ncbi:TIGR03089 family protein [Pseudonocardia sp. HH130630-07]|uniref:TIGR03089 family protein n=1 Tax=Pseudonocardia sp. HH130630-07 TaxID=1690815 RepID=UPI000815274C|nr:TIGR03089 family protein [Pseudonocardia sp. HH130630-07]ANY07569.1 acetyl-CoA synthetase [Pseudonocardia sp. HH130630-07]
MTTVFGSGLFLTDALLGPALGAAAARPLFTHYDDASGERMELSGTTTANWTAKAANLLRDECDVEPGTRVAVLLPAHWQTAAALLAAWSCGAELVGDPAAADLVLADAARLDTALAAGADTTVAFSLDAFGRGISGLPAGVLDFASEVRVHGDDFVPWDPVDDAAPAWDGASGAEVLAAARDRAVALGVAAGDRVLSTTAWDSPDGLRDGLLAVLGAGASLVQVVNPGPDPSVLRRRADTERTTVRLSSLV